MLHRSAPIVRTLRAFATQQDINNAMSMIEVLARPDLFQREYKSFCHRLSATTEVIYSTFYNSLSKEDRKAFLEISYEFSRSIDGYDHPNRNTNSVADTDVFVTTKPGIALQYGPIPVLDRKSRSIVNPSPSAVKCVVTPVGQLKLFSDEESLEYFRDQSIGFHHFTSKGQHKVADTDLMTSVKNSPLKHEFKKSQNFDGSQTTFLLLSGTSVILFGEIYMGIPTHQKILWSELRCNLMHVVGSGVFNFVNNTQEQNTHKR
jgi:hypothetical protein